jgi:hypothetical protein
MTAEIYPKEGILALPPELILNIIDHLDDVSKICLAINCRTLLPHLSSRLSFGLEPLSKERLLLLLEQDIPTLYYCHNCIKLHPWHPKGWFWFDGPYSYIKSHAPCKDKKSLSWMNGLHFLFPVARLAMTRHIFGDAHGPPIEQLNHQYQFRHPYGADFSITYRARIINDQLLMSSEMVIWHPKADSKLLRWSVDDLRYNICNHLHMDGVFGTLRIPELRCEDRRPDDFTPCVQSAKSCPNCMTDYCIDIVHLDGERKWFSGKTKRGWVIKLSTYHQFGSLRSPSDWQWDSMRGFPSTKDKRRQAESSTCGVGMIRHLWSTADQAVVRPDGEWAKVRDPFQVGQT